MFMPIPTCHFTKKYTGSFRQTGSKNKQKKHSRRKMKIFRKKNELIYMNKVMFVYGKDAKA